MEPFLELIKRLTQGKPGINFADYIQQALYHPTLGYYRRQSTRVGHHSEADFYTAESLGPVFGELVAAACVALAGQDEARECALVEIGVEGESPVLAAAAPFFREVRPIRVGDTIGLPDCSVVFCNELLDAQPFHRLIYKDGRWHERGVAVEDGQLREVLLPEFSDSVAAVAAALPDQAAEGYQLDLPLGSEQLVARLAADSRMETFVAFDYGLDWTDIVFCRPGGTARTYSRQKLGDDLLDRPGEIDITCHICWDRVEAVLRKAGFSDVRLLRQEAFFMHHAMNVMQDIIRSGDIRRQSTLRELLHPSRLGSSFQVLVARR